MLPAYLSECTALLSQVRPKLASLDLVLSNRSALSRELDTDFAQLDSLVRLVDIELRKGASDTSTTANARALIAEIRTLKETKSKSDLVAHEGKEGSETRAYHGRFKNTTARLQASSEVLNESRRTILETETVAAGIAEKLLDNRATIEASHSKLLETGGMMGRAHRAMRSMQQRETQRKIILLGAVVFVVILLLWAFISLVMPSSPVSPPAAAPSPSLAPTNKTP